MAETNPEAHDPSSLGLSKGLKVGALGLVASVIVGVASTAPAYSLASALGGVVGTVGLQSPAVMILAFVPMFLIAIAYRELNKAVPDCGTTFTWATRAFGQRPGWMGGWGILAADIIVMANLAAIAGLYTLQFFGLYKQAANMWWVLGVGVVWTIAMTYIAWRGIEVSARLQMALLAIEVVMLGIFSVTALVKVYSGHGTSGSIKPSLSLFNPFHITGFGALAAGLLLATFIYWGWDTAVSANEETKDPAKTPGRAAVISTLLLLVTYALVTVAAQAFAGVGSTGIVLNNPNNSGDVLSVLGSSVFGTTGLGWVLAKLLLFMVLTSSAASAQTTILPTARTVLSMATFKALPDKFARVNPKYLTPGYATVAMGVVSIAFYVIMTILSSNILTVTIGSLGLMIAFYYGLTGYASAWYYRKILTRSASDFINKGLLPLLGGLSLTAIFWYGLWYYATGYDPKDSSTYFSFFGHKIGDIAVIGVGVLLLGVVLMVIYNIVRPDFFRGETLTMGTHLDIIGEPPASLTGFTLPDSGSQEVLVVSSDPEISGLTQEETDTLVQTINPDELAVDSADPNEEFPTQG